MGAIVVQIFFLDFFGEEEIFAKAVAGVGFFFEFVVILGAELVDFGVFGVAD